VASYNEKGLYLLEVVVPGEKEGETTQYEYNRKGTYKECQSSETEIHVVYYENGTPVGGISAAKFVGVKWEIL
jgi:hypothetical protein